MKIRNILFLLPNFILNTSHYPQTTYSSVFHESHGQFNLPAQIHSDGSIKSESIGSGLWTELNPNIPSVDYLGIHFINKDTGWACGNYGVIIKTTNGGGSWVRANTGSTILLLKIHSYNDSTVIAVGYDKTILRSTDGGMNFLSVQTNLVSGTNLWGLKLVSDSVGYLCGSNNTLMKTTNGGLTWQKLITPGYNLDYWGIDFFDVNNGFIAATGKILKTTDGGASWGIIPAGDSYPLISVHAIDSLHIAASGYGGTGYPAKNIYSSNGGFTWINGGTLAARNANCIHYINRDTGYIAQSDSGMYKTTNRGQTWQRITNNIGEYDFTILPGNIGYSVGISMKIFKASGNTDTWNKLILNENLKDVYFINEFKGFAVSPDGSGILFRTDNAGLSWQKVIDAPGGNAIAFTDSLTGYIGTREIGSTSAKIYKTTDGGMTWHPANISNHIGSINKIFFVNSVTGWTVSAYSSNSQAKILTTVDGGETWAVQFQLDNSNGLTSVFFNNPLDGWVVGRSVWQTTNGGLTWTKRTDIPENLFSDIYFNNSSDGWIVAANQMYKTTDGGINWSITPYALSNSQNFEVVSDNYFIISGLSIWESTDAGLTWHEVTNTVGRTFASLHAPKDYLAYAVGNNGTILKYYNSALVPVELINFSLNQLNNNAVELKWSTASESNNYGFEIQHSSNMVAWKTIGFIEGNGSTSVKHDYTFIDDHLKIGYNYYRLKQIDFDGSLIYSNILTINNPCNNFSLAQNYPNPANPETNISFNLARKSWVKIELFSVTGEVVKLIVNEERESGMYHIHVDLGDFSSGLYFCRMITNNGFTAIKKIMLIK